MSVFCCFAIVGSVLLWSAWLVAALHEKGIYPVREVLDRWGRLGVTGKVIVTLFVAHLAIYGSTKPSGTNGVDQVGSAFLGGCGPLGTTAPTVAVRPYRLESVSTNEGYSYAMPVGGSIRGTWHLTGAYEDVQRVVLDGFAFPLGSDLCTSLWAYTWGKVRPQLKNASNEIAAVGSPMSAIPDVSRFWTAATSNDTYLLTWENFTLGRIAIPTNASSLIPDPSSLVSAQVELKRNGDFITRSNDVECVYRRVIEPNPIVDPINPPDPVDPSKPLYPYGSVQDLSVIEETNAYCWVDIVVNAADAWVRFEGDGASNLADPSFAAKAGETNHVVILIGKTYKVTCDMPFTVVGKSDPAIDEWWEDGNTLWLNWPVNIRSIGDDEEPPLLLLGFGSGSHRGNGFTMYVSPSGLGGGFNWTNSCCSVSGSGYYFSYNCNDDCHCRGCAASGYFSYEGYRLPAWGGSCRCSYDDEPDDPHDDDPDDPPPPAGVSIYFSETAVIFEDEYHPASNSTVQARSTTTRLCCSVYGGEHGGSVLITATGIDNRLDCIGGSQTFPVYRQLEPRETFAFTNSYKAIAQSGSANDIVVTGTFIANDTGESFDDEDKATAIRVKFEPVALAPENPSSQRHKFGVRELVDCEQYPSSPQIDWVVIQGEVTTPGHRYRCPMSAIGNPLKARCCGAEYTPIISVVEPSTVVAKDAGFNDFGAAYGEAGKIALTLPLYIGPFDVSFSEIAVEEVPAEDRQNDQSAHTGYFNRNDLCLWWTHSRGNGAGRWYDVDADNRMGGGNVYDQAGLTNSLSRVNSAGMFVDDPDCLWTDGTLTLDNPFGWNIKGTRGTTHPYDTFAEDVRDVIELRFDGRCRVWKLNNEVIRYVDGHVYLNGEFKK